MKEAPPPPAPPQPPLEKPTEPKTALNKVATSRGGRSSHQAEAAVPDGPELRHPDLIILSGEAFGGRVQRAQWAGCCWPPARAEQRAQEEGDTPRGVCDLLSCAPGVPGSRFLPRPQARVAGTPPDTTLLGPGASSPRDAALIPSSQDPPAALLTPAPARPTPGAQGTTRGSQESSRGEHSGGRSGQESAGRGWPVTGPIPARGHRSRQRCHLRHRQGPSLPAPCGPVARQTHQAAPPTQALSSAGGQLGAWGPDAGGPWGGD